MFSWLPQNVKRKVKGEWKGLRTALIRRNRAFSRQDLLRELRRVGVQLGDTLLVHSSLEPFAGFSGKPMDVIESLEEAIGSTGTLLMPTLPFTGSAVEYVSQPRTFDVKKTPSRMGLLTELFRRAPGVVRSVHPTHSAAIWGTCAREIADRHYEAGTPCGRQTPYGRLLDRGGKILFLGTDISVMTFYHTVEELLEPQMPFSPFTKEVFTLESHDEAGNTQITHTRLFDPTCSRRRNLWKLVPVLKRRRAWSERRLGQLRLILLRGEDVLEACLELSSQGRYCYGK